jgi:hypothetical protein
VSHEADLVPPHLLRVQLLQALLLQLLGLHGLLALQQLRVGVGPRHHLRQALLLQQPQDVLLVLVQGLQRRNPGVIRRCPTCMQDKRILL